MENLRLKEHLRAYRIRIEDGDIDPEASLSSYLNLLDLVLTLLQTQKSLLGTQGPNSVYFGSLSLVDVVAYAGKLEHIGKMS